MTDKPDYAADAAQEFFLDAWTEATSLATGTDEEGQRRGVQMVEAIERAKGDLADTIRTHYRTVAREAAVDREVLKEAQRRERHAVAANLRLTKLLRGTLPEERQHGHGLDGMVESLLAYVVELQGLAADKRRPAVEEIGAAIARERAMWEKATGYATPAAVTRRPKGST